MSERAHFFAGTADDRVRAVYAFATAQGAQLREPELTQTDDATPAWRALSRAGLAAPGLAFADWVELDAAGGVVQAILVNCPDVAGFLRLLGRYHPLIGRAQLTVDLQPFGAVIEVAEEPGRPAHPDLVDACFGLLLRIIQRLTGDLTVRCHLDLRRRQPDRSDQYEQRFGTVRFATEHDRFILGLDLLKAPLLGADPTLVGLLEPYADAQLASPVRNWSRDTSELVVERLEMRPTLEEVARELAVSGRSLQQYLRREGTTYAQIVDEARRRQVLAMLGVKGTPLFEIARRVGMRSEASLARAIRRWTGQTSGQLRASRPSG